jgi:ABC-type antimicrobial peptide transport system permease subunit
MILVGLVLGLIGTLWTTAVLESVLFQVSALDPFAIVLACSSMVLVGLLAGFIPASRAARVDPMMVLRNEG